MGQSSLPVLNKTGRTTNWTNIWDDRYYYNIKFEEDIFIKIFFELFFKHGFRNYVFYFTDNFLIRLNNFYYYKYYSELFSLNFYRKRILKTYKTKRKFIFYFMRFHILRFENNIIIFTRIYFPFNIKKSNPLIKEEFENNFYHSKDIFLIYLFPKIKNLFFFENF